MIHYLTPYRTDKNLGKAYNDAMRLLPDGDTALLMDIDVMFLLPEQPAMIERHVGANPNAVLTCYTNRISPASYQLYQGTVSDNPNILDHVATAQAMRPGIRWINRCISGFLMVVPVSVWRKHPFPETGQALGVDTIWSKNLLRHGIRIGIMTDIYVFHYYRLAQGRKDKSHLL